MRIPEAWTGCQVLSSVTFHLVPLREGLSLAWKLDISARLPDQSRDPSFSDFQG